MCIYLFKYIYIQIDDNILQVLELYRLVGSNDVISVIEKVLLFMEFVLMFVVSPTKDSALCIVNLKDKCKRMYEGVNKHTC